MNLISADPFADSSSGSRTEHRQGHDFLSIRPNGTGETHRTLFHDPKEGITIERDFAVNNELFDDVLRVRKRSSGAEPNDLVRAEVDDPVFGFDASSYQYCLYVDGEPVGSLTSTAEADGVMDCRDRYPDRLLSAFSDRAFSPCKFSISRNRFSSFRLMRLMVREYWQDQLNLGGRLAVMNARTGLIPFYQRMGFLVLKDSDFKHPYCGTQSVSLVLPADPSLRSYFSDLFDAINDPLSIDLIRLYCETIDPPQRRQLAMQS